MDLNRVTLIGRVAADTQARTTKGGVTFLEFALATSKSWQDSTGQKQEKTEWHKIVVWGKQAQFVAPRIKKGSTVLVEGELETQSWEKDGVKHYKTIVNARFVEAIDKSRSEAQAPVAQDIFQDDIPF
jgi:single-strand DNA-binding protein